MNKEVIRTDRAPAAIGPYEQAVVAGGMLYSSGQIPLEPKTGQVTGESIEEQTKQVMDNLKAVLEAGGASLESVVKVTVFLTDMGEFKRFNEVYGGYFPENRPARSTVQVAALPRGVKVEAEAVAVVRG